MNLPKRLPKGLKIANTTNAISARLYNTEIVTVEVPDSILTLRCGGWYTMHTKKCMNLVFQSMGLNYNVFQRKNQWFVTMPDKHVVPFLDGMKLNIFN